jgi:AraC family transcriptional regulator of adaptative response/methylated-DNA-[protein]-cysteine methyltransferase
MTRFTTPLGAMVAAATPRGVCLLEFADRRGLENELRDLARRLNCVAVPEEDDALRRVRTEMADYFDGRLRDFTVPLDLVGSPFQLRAWEALRRVPYGVTRSYAEQAASIGSPAAVRAVGRANGMNRVAIVVPCHRVVGADGKLTGYGGGLWRKRRLLDLERGVARLPLPE